MKLARLLGFICFILSHIFVPAPANAADVRLLLKTGKGTYRLGDHIDFHIDYQNVSNRSLVLLPQTDSYPVDAISIRKVKDFRQPEVIRLAEQSIDFEGLSKNVVVLQSHDSVGRSIKAEVGSSLPTFYADYRRGLFLIFSASAIRLPGFGKYEVRARFHSSPDHPVNAYLGRQVLWRGDVESEPIIIEISK
jgi:hypothetical protein